MATIDSSYHSNTMLVDSEDTPPFASRLLSADGDPLYSDDNVTGSCFGYPNVSEAHDFFLSMAAHIRAVGRGITLGEAESELTHRNGKSSKGLIKYPIVIGQTYQGRNIRALCLGWRCELGEDQESDPTVPQALFTGLHHAREPTSLGVLYYFIRDLVQKYVANDPATMLLLHSRQLWFIPIVNPDGYAANCADMQGHMVRTNLRPACTRTHGNRGPGVDLNRNYPICFDRAIKDHSASTHPCVEDYQGTEPFSEPETAAIRDLTYRHNFTFAMNYHSYGKEITMPYGCKVLGKPQGLDYKIFIGLGDRITALNGFMYGVGWEKPLDLYTVSGAAQDWMYRDRGIYALMSEVGPLYKKGTPMKPSFWFVACRLSWRIHTYMHQSGRVGQLLLTFVKTEGNGGEENTYLQPSSLIEKKLQQCT